MSLSSFLATGFQLNFFPLEVMNFKSTASFTILQQFQYFFSLVFAINRCFRECFSLPSQSNLVLTPRKCSKGPPFKRKTRYTQHAPCCRVRDLKFSGMRSIAFHRQVYNNNTDFAHSSHLDFRFPTRWQGTFLGSKTFCRISSFR